MPTKKQAEEVVFSITFFQSAWVSHKCSYKFNEVHILLMCYKCINVLKGLKSSPEKREDNRSTCLEEKSEKIVEDKS